MLTNSAEELEAASGPFIDAYITAAQGIASDLG